MNLFLHFFIFSIIKTNGILNIFKILHIIFFIGKIIFSNILLITLLINIKYIIIPINRPINKYKRNSPLLNLNILVNKINPCN